MDSGTCDGSDQSELTQLQTYNTGANENPNVTQSAPTSRAVQNTTGAVNDAATTGTTGGGHQNAQAAAQGGSSPNGQESGGSPSGAFGMGFGDGGGSGDPGLGDLMKQLGFGPTSPFATTPYIPGVTGPADGGGFNDLLYRGGDSPVGDPGFELTKAPAGFGHGPAVAPQAPATPFSFSDPRTYWPALQALGNDAANQAASAIDAAKREAQLLPGTLQALPGAVGDTFSNGQAWDSFQGMAQNSKLFRLAKPMLVDALPKAPLYGHQQEYDNGANVVAPLADEAALQAVLGAATGGLGKAVCGLAKLGRWGRYAAGGLKTLMTGANAARTAHAASALNDALKRGDSVGAAKALIEGVKGSRA
jgi:hypothetical protein